MIKLLLLIIDKFYKKRMWLVNAKKCMHWFNILKIKNIIKLD